MSVHEQPKDHVDEPGEYERRDRGAIEDKATWLRLLFMAVMAALFCLGVVVALVVVVLQFFWVLFKGETKEELTAIGRQLGEYTREIVLFMTFNTEERPFPFDRDWPKA